ncbi:transcription factor bHLH36-like [Senna tora]|uniref:Transcription factor bHLH36-like n=1 Tax=Senna tora TaxID=362788 RepID=A0A834W9B4_9FABA|nr:transcription factor bHLH36-like [Senna tora]
MVICSLFNRNIVSGRVCNLIESEFALRRSRSMEISFLRSRSKFFGGDRDFDPDITEESMAPNRSKSTSSMFKPIPSSSSSDPLSLPIQTIPEDQILHDHQIESHFLNFNTENLVTTTPSEGKGKKQQNQFQNKRSMHRETERQRRQEMATLFASLRSLLPLEYIKGKRSISDHMHEAVNYIKYSENKVKNLKAKRDELEKLCNLSSISVIVHPFKGGAEIMCSYSFNNYRITQSQILSLMLQQGLNMVSYNFTNTDERSILTIRFEDCDMAETENDYSELQRKLTEAILSTNK